MIKKRSNLGHYPFNAIVLPFTVMLVPPLVEIVGTVAPCRYGTITNLDRVVVHKRNIYCISVWAVPCAA